MAAHYASVRSAVRHTQQHTACFIRRFVAAWRLLLLKAADEQAAEYPRALRVGLPLRPSWCGTLLLLRSATPSFFADVRAAFGGMARKRDARCRPNTPAAGGVVARHARAAFGMAKRCFYRGDYRASLLSALLRISA